MMFLIIFKSYFIRFMFFNLFNIHFGFYDSIKWILNQKRIQINSNSIPIHFSPFNI